MTRIFPSFGWRLVIKQCIFWIGVLTIFRRTRRKRRHSLVWSQRHHIYVYLVAQFTFVFLGRRIILEPLNIKGIFVGYNDTYDLHSNIAKDYGELKCEVWWGCVVLKIIGISFSDWREWEGHCSKMWPRGIRRERYNLTLYFNLWEVEMAYKGIARCTGACRSA